MPAPVGLVPADFAAYVEGLEARIAELESPGSPKPLYVMTTTQMSAANAATYAFCHVLNSTLNIIAHSNGVHWYREDTGALIV